MTRPSITATTHTLPFDKLSPSDFERLCLWLVEREGYEHPEHLGLAGSEKGRDVVAYKPTLRGKELWYFQCKRYSSISAKILVGEVVKYLQLGEEKPHLRPDGIVFVVSCAVSAAAREEVDDYCAKHGITCEFWALTELDMLVKRHPDLLREFFSSPTLLLRPVIAASLLIVLAGTAMLMSSMLRRYTPCERPAGWVEYTVRQGDTVWDLATAHHIPPLTLLNGNCLASQSLEPGQVIFVPSTRSDSLTGDDLLACGEAPAGWIRVTVGPMQTLHYLALGYDVNIYELAYVNCLGQFEVWTGQTIWVPPRPFDIAEKLRALEPQGVLTYTVQVGDTIQGIAAAFDRQPETILWANDLNGFPDEPQIGQELVILPLDGAYHLVKGGETVESIAAQYQVEVSAITSLRENQFVGPGFALISGQHLIVPGAEKPHLSIMVALDTGPVPAGASSTGSFQWPTLGRITQGYWYDHRAIDIGAPTGSEVLAADGGFVSFAGSTHVGYGNLIVIDHVNGLTTYYAHLSNIYVSERQVIERGQVIGAVGRTGAASGPHLHFELRYHGVQQDPRAYLP